MNYESILGLRSGQWKPLPKSEYILVFRTVYVKCEACSLEEFEKENRGHFQVSLINHQRRTIIHESKSSKEVFALASGGFPFAILLQSTARHDAMQVGMQT